jgi:predicted nucleotidyltransferase
MATTTSELEAAIADFIARLHKGLRVEVVILYGSHAAGTPHQWSDIDLAVVSPDFEGVPMWRRQEIIARLTLDRCPNISPIGYSSTEYREPSAHSLLSEIVRSGRVVYHDADNDRL